jgi:hypothetical protein
MVCHPFAKSILDRFLKGLFPGTTTTDQRTVDIKENYLHRCRFLCNCRESFFATGLFCL